MVVSHIKAFQSHIQLQRPTPQTDSGRCSTTSRWPCFRTGPVPELTCTGNHRRARDQPWLDRFLPCLDAACFVILQRKIDQAETRPGWFFQRAVRLHPFRAATNPQSHLHVHVGRLQIALQPGSRRALKGRSTGGQ